MGRFQKPKTKNPFVSRDEFIESAGKTAEEVIKERKGFARLPWENPMIKENETKEFLLRMKKKYKLMADWLKQETGLSVHKTIEDILYEGLEKRIKKILKLRGLR